MDHVTFILGENVHFWSFFFKFEEISLRKNVFSLKMEMFQKLKLSQKLTIYTCYISLRVWHSSIFGLKIRLIYINFDENWLFLPYLVKNSFFGSNYKMKALNFTFYMSYWSLSNFLPNDTMFDRWYGCFVLILGQKHCFLAKNTDFGTICAIFGSIHTAYMRKFMFSIFSKLYYTMCHIIYHNL